MALPGIAAAVIVTAFASSIAVDNASGVQSNPTASDGLFTLATTGWADDRAAEGYGKAHDKDGGMPGAFTYGGESMPGKAAADALLGAGEFLAPHYIANWDGSVDVMVAPHLLVNGEVMHGLNANKDHFIRVTRDGVALRFDYSDDVAK